MLGSFLRFLHREVFQSLGYLYALRDGNLLGAVRHGGLIPGDNDLDAIVLLPIDSDGFGGGCAACAELPKPPSLMFLT